MTTANATTARAWQVVRYGAPSEALELTEIPTPIPEPREILVRVATSVIRTGMLTLEVDGKMQTFPLIKAAKGSAAARERLKNLYPI